MKIKRLSLLVVTLFAVFASRSDDQPAKRTEPFILGADITFLLEDEAAGAEFYDHGVKKDFFQILKDNKFNYVRVSTIVEPTRNFSRGDLAHIKILAKRAKAAGVGLLVNFFYSDDWASPENQPKPAVWTKLA
jgi:arabinogalactan endo-1,4-beta-galactosidase